MALILVVEDDPDNQDVLTTMLQIAGHTTVIASNGAEALRLAAERYPALILMDMGLPVMDGWMATTQLKAHPQLATIPVIAVTSYAMTEDAQRARAVGCTDYIAKPIDYTVLTTKVVALLPGDVSSPRPNASAL